MTKKLIFFLLFLLVLPMAFSQPPVNYFVISEAPDGLDITFPTFNYVQLDQNFTYDFHTINKSNGVLIDNTLASCQFVLYNKTGSHIYDLENVPAHDDHFKIEIDGSNFSESGTYGYTVICNTSDNGGFVSVSFDVTKTGEAEVNNLYAVIIGIIAIITFFSIVGYYQRKRLGAMLVCFSVALAEMVNLAFLLYLRESGKSMIPILKINFWVVFLTVFGIAAIALILLFLRALNLDDSMEEDDDKKWQDRR